MKVLVATTSYPRKKGDTAGIFVHKLAKSIKDRGAEVFVMAPSCGMDDEEREIEGIKVHRFRYFFIKKWEILFCRGGGAVPALTKKPYLHLLLPFALLSYTISILKRAKDADVIQAEWSISGFASIPSKILLRKKVVVSLLGSDMMKAKGSPVYRWITRITFKFADAITSVSKRMVDEAISIGADPERVRFIPYGTDEKFLNITPAEFKKPYNLLYVGNLIPLKRVHVAIKALSELPEDFRLYIVGDGPQRKELKVLANTLGVGHRVYFEGRVPHEEIPSYLSRSHALLLLSESEGRPNVVLEALAAGVPVVASDIPGNRELVVNSENGILVPVDDHKSVVGAIISLFQDEEKWKAMSKRAKEFVRRERLLWKFTAEDHINLYSELLR